MYLAKVFLEKNIELYNENKELRRTIDNLNR